MKQAMKSRNGKRVPHSNQHHVFVFKHTNYILWVLMCHTTDCQTLASLSASQSAFYWFSLWTEFYTLHLHLSNRDAHTHTQAYSPMCLCPDDNNQCHMQHHAQQTASLIQLARAHFIPKSIICPPLSLTSIVCCLSQ